MAKQKEEEAKELNIALSSITGDKVEIQHLLESGAIPSSLDTPEKLMTVIKTGEEVEIVPEAHHGGRLSPARVSRARRVRRVPQGRNCQWPQIWAPDT